MFRRASDVNSIPSVFPTFLQSSLPFRRKSRQSSSDSCSSTLSTLSGASSKCTTSTQSSNPFSRCSTPVPVPLQEQEILEPTDKFLHAHSSHLQCAKCSTDLALTSQIISKGFTGRHGRAYLVQGSTLPGRGGIHMRSVVLPNTFLGKAVPRSLVTGQHTVSDLFCSICGSLLGWKYVNATEESQKYKVGKFILETKKIRIGVNWEDHEQDADESGEWEEVGHLSMNELRRMSDTVPAVPASSTPGLKSTAQEDIAFDSQDEDECEDLFAGVWSPALAKKRRQRKMERTGRARQRVMPYASATSSRESLGTLSRDSSRPVSRSR